MKKIIFRMISIAAVIILCAPLLAACSGTNMPGSRAEKYENADRYTPVAPDGVKIAVNVKKICIYWTAGSVTFGQAFGDAIELYEDSTSTLDTRTRMHYYFDGETLYVRFTVSGSFTLDALSKKLTINLPAATRYDEIEIKTVSASVRAEKIAADDIDIETVSGRIRALGVDASESVSLETVSGDIECSVSGKAGDVKLGTVSGNALLTLVSKAKLKVGTTSGPVKIMAHGYLTEADFDSVSGSVTLGITAGAGFDAKFQTVSGEFSSDFSLKPDGSHYTCGDGSLKLDFSTVSGNVKIVALDSPTDF